MFLPPLSNAKGVDTAMPALWVQSRTLMRTLWFVQVTQYKLSNIEDLSACQVLHTAADEAEVRGYIYRLLEPLSYLAPDLGLGELQEHMKSRIIPYGSHQCLTSLVSDEL